MKTRVLAAALAAIVGTAACATAGGRGEPRGPTLNPDLLVSAEDLADDLNDANLVIVHVGRDRASYDAGHIPGARFLPLSSIAEERAGLPNELPPVERLDSVFESLGIGDGTRVVLYGDLDGLAAGRAFFTLDYLGHQRTAVLDGGLAAWRTEGGAVSREAPGAPAPASFTPNPQPQRMVDAAWVRTHLDSTKIALIDARPVAEYTGETPGADVTRPGHIRGAENLFWKNTLLSEANPVLRTPAVLRGMLRLAGADPGDTVVVYCRSGVQASHLYFVSRYLGYETKLYDGSFVDWSRRADYPVVRGAAASDSTAPPATPAKTGVVR